MSKIQSIIEDLQSRGYSDRDLLAALKDGEALAKLGLGDDDQDDIETAFNSIFDRVYPYAATPRREVSEDELEDLRERRIEEKIRYSIKGDL